LNRSSNPASSNKLFVRVLVHLRDNHEILGESENDNEEFKMANENRHSIRACFK